MNKVVTLLLLIFLSVQLNAQNDSIVLSTNDILIGQIKVMDKGVLILKTDYSDSDFKIKWTEVTELYTKRKFIVALSNGQRITAVINTDTINKKEVSLDTGGFDLKTTLKDVILLDQTGSHFYNKINASIDFGITLTKTNDYQQLTTNAKIGYRGQKWNANSSFDYVFTHQDEVEDIQRTQARLSIQRILPKEWFIQSVTDLLSNTEQRLKLRSTGGIGPGYYFMHNNTLAFGASAGLAFNNETYIETIEQDKNSLESYFILSYEKYDLGDLSIISSVNLSPSLTEKGRFRADLNFQMKYDLPLDFYIRTSVTYNYDNQPAIGAAEEDYVFSTSFGWELD